MSSFGPESLSLGDLFHCPIFFLLIYSGGLLIVPESLIFDFGKCIES